MGLFDDIGNFVEDTWSGFTGAVDDLWGGLSGRTSVEEATDAQLQAQKEARELGMSQLAPYSEAGLLALQQQQALSGALGPEAQQEAYSTLEGSPAFQSMLQQGETSMLQNAAATGGLRGGNTQAAMAQFAPQLLNQFAQQQYQNLGGLTSLGQNAAAGAGNMGFQTGIMGGQTAAEGILGQYQTQKNFLSDLAALGMQGAMLVSGGSGGGGAF